MLKTISGSAVVTLVATAMFAFLPGQATASSGQDYSQHVRACQQAMGFNGTHNPGVMHRGFSGWDPEHGC